MKETRLVCDRCHNDIVDTLPVTAFSVKIGGFNYAEDFPVRDRDFCRTCLTHITNTLAEATAPLAGKKIAVTAKG